MGRRLGRRVAGKGRERARAGLRGGRRSPLASGPRAPLTNRVRAVGVRREGDDLELSWGEPLVAGNRAAVEWWAALTESGELVTLAGTSWLTFGDDGRVVEQHDYWTVTPGRSAPWKGWGS
jgi:hypothetical protein